MVITVPGAPETGVNEVICGPVVLFFKITTLNKLPSNEISGLPSLSKSAEKMGPSQFAAKFEGEENEMAPPLTAVFLNNKTESRRVQTAMSGLPSPSKSLIVIPSVFFPVG